MENNKQQQPRYHEHSRSEDAPYMSFRNIGKELGISECRVQQIFQEAIAKLQRKARVRPLRSCDATHANLQTMLELALAMRKSMTVDIGRNRIARAAE